MADTRPENTEILARSPEEGARRLALSYLDQAVAALPRLHDREDPEALHDVRVALRRLRSSLRSYAGQLGGSVTPKLARRLKKLGHSTGPGRDIEVQMAWLGEQERELTRHQRRGLVWLLGRLGARRDAAYEELRGRFAEDFAPLAARLREHLAVYRAEVRLDAGPAPSFAAAAAAAVRSHAADLDRRLARVRGAGDVVAAHRARISAKRLRYLAEPLADLLAGAGEAPAAGAGSAPTQRRPPRPLNQLLKTLQDLLGELHDAHVMEEALAAALADAAAERSRHLLAMTLAAPPADERQRRAGQRRPIESGLLELARRNRARRDQLFAEFASRWQGDGAKPLDGAVADLAAALQRAAPEEAEPAAAPPTE